ncbi:MAG TPA: hypothetical protein VJV03_14665 [Pyrinomonadaceae bacterium]|nr:hypothetical protein [Pyrinomonadaceae bacterium]
MQLYNLCFIGFGNVGRALARLLALKSNELKNLYGIDWRITGIASRRIGWLADSNGFDVSQIVTEPPIADRSFGEAGIKDWLQAAQADVVFETTSLNHQTGEPALSYLKAALQSSCHAITANKGAVVYGYHELTALANAAGKRFMFESAVLDSAPVFSLFREALPAVKLRGFSGLFSSTTNVILETIEAGRSFAEGVKTAQDLGVAETDPSDDIEGWDATVKVCALANVLMNARMTPVDVNREGIADLDPRKVQAARAEGKPYKLVARARESSGKLTASVRPEQIAPGDPLANVRGTSLAVHFELDMMPGLTITSHRPNLQSTAYGLLADFVNAVK